MSPRTSLDRRQFLGDSATLLGSTALATLLGQDGALADTPIRPAINPASVAGIRVAVIFSVPGVRPASTACSVMASG